jgi:hypothetical protein
MATYYWTGGATACWNGQISPQARLPAICSNGLRAGHTYSKYTGHDVNDRYNWTLVGPLEGGYTYTGYPPAPTAPPPGSDVVFTRLFNFGDASTLNVNAYPIVSSTPIGTIRVPGGSTAARLNSVKIGETVFFNIGIWRDGFTAIDYGDPGSCQFGAIYGPKWGHAQWSNGLGCCAFSFYAKDLYLNTSLFNGTDGYKILYLIRGTDVGTTNDCVVHVRGQGFFPNNAGNSVHLSGYIKKITHDNWVDASNFIHLHGRDTVYGLTGVHISDEIAIESNPTSHSRFTFNPGISFSHPNAKINLLGKGHAIDATTGLNIPNTTINMLSYNDNETINNRIYVYGGHWNYPRYLEEQSSDSHVFYTFSDYVIGCTLGIGQCPPVTFGTVNLTDYQYRSLEYPHLTVDRGKCHVNKLKIENGRLNIEGNQGIDKVTINGGYLNPLRSSITSDSACLEINDDRSVEGGFVIRNAGLDVEPNIPIYVRGNENLRYDITDPGYSYGEIIFNF